MRQRAVDLDYTTYIQQQLSAFSDACDSCCGERVIEQRRYKKTNSGRVTGEETGLVGPGKRVGRDSPRVHP